jgi:hypothetical protein
LANGGDIKPTTLSFEDKKDFFSIYNSFECSSKMEKCTSRILPPFETFDLKASNSRQFYPVMIMALEDESICELLYSFLVFYIDSATLSETEKSKSKMFL